MKLIYIDTETTGAVPRGPDAHDVVQLAAIIEIDGQIVERFTLECAPFRPMNYEPEALSITGTTVEELLLRPNPRDTYKKFTDVLHRHRNRYDKKDRFFFVAYNAQFDYQVLIEHAKRAGDEWFMTNFWSPPICVMATAANILMPVRHLMPNFKLETVCQYCEIEFDKSKAHDALYDLDKTVELYKKLTA